MFSQLFFRALLTFGDKPGTPDEWQMHGFGTKEDGRL